MTPDETEEPRAVVLTLTQQTLALLRKLAGPDALHPDHTPETLAVVWLHRWQRREHQDLDYYDHFGPGTETMTVAVDGQLWQALRKYGVSLGWRPDQTASAVLNDSGGRIAPADICDTMG